MNQKVTIQAGKSHVLDNTKCGNALVAIEELIWNALDADADNVTVTFNRGSLEVIESIQVEDDGEGLPFDKWKDAFGQLGDSPKLLKRTTTSGRHVHGQNGKGRLKTLGVGSLVTWKSRFTDKSKVCSEYTISANRSNIREFVATEPVNLIGERSSGVSVEIRQLGGGIAKLDNKEAVAIELAQKFCLYLSQYPGVSILFDGIRLDPETNKSHEATYPLIIEVGAGKTVAADLTVIEWKQASERAIYLCDTSGFARDEMKTKIKKSTGWKFTAYLRSKYVDELEQEGKLLLAGLDQHCAAFIEAGHDAIAKHFLARESVRAKELVGIWKSEKIYPYTNEPASPIEDVEQKVFDVCAMNVSTFIKDFDTSSKSNKRLTFRLIREALAQNPTKLGRILREVVSLPKAQQDDLSNMLDRAKMSAIISASNQVIGRLRFLDSLDDMIYGSMSKTLNEPRQLHRILARELWIFGDQYNLGADEKGLRNVLKAHIDILGRNDLVTDDVKLLNGKDARFDLMLWTQVPTKQTHVEHLVIELKRPTVKIGAEEISQITQYAVKVANDSRFNKEKTTWRFILVGKEMDEYADEVCRNDDRTYGHLKSGNPSIFLTTWSSLIRDARYRYEFFKKELAVELSDDDGLKYLREKHGEFFAEDWSVPRKTQRTSNAKKSQKAEAFKTANPSSQST